MNTSHAIDHPSGIQAVRLGNSAEGLLYTPDTPTFRWYVDAIRDGLIRLHRACADVVEVHTASGVVEAGAGDWVVRQPQRSLSVWVDQQMSSYLLLWDADQEGRATHRPDETAARLNAPTSQVERLEWLLTSTKVMLQEREDAEEENVLLRRRVRRLRTERDMARQEVLAVLRKEIAGLLGNGTADELPHDGEYATALNDVLGLLGELEGEAKYTALVVQDSPKMLMETLAVAQIAIDSYPDQSRITAHRNRLQRLANECARHRPLGPDGKHGDLHTSTCGCEDK